MEQAATGARQGFSGRLLALTRIPPLLQGGLLAALLVASLVGLAWAAGDLAMLSDQGRPWWENRDARLALLVALVLAAVTTALRTHAVGTRRDLAAVARLGSWRVEDIDPARLPGDARRAWLAGAVGATCVPLIALLVDRDPGVYFQEGYWLLTKVWTWILGVAATCTGGVLFQRTIRDARLFSRLAWRLPRVDLLDPSSLAPFARQALRATVPGLLALTFVALNAADRGFAWAIGVVGSLSLVGGGLVLAVPLRSVRDRVRRAKREELRRVNAAIRGEPGALAGSPIEARAPDALADLLAWRREVTAVPEWPLDPTTLGRYGLYLAIPLASWIGAALVERLLDRALA